MRNLILSVATSLDGFIEDARGAFDWCFTDQDYGMKDFVNRIDSLFMGRKTYEVTVKMGGTGFPNLKNYVFSNSLRKAEGDVILVQGDIISKVQQIKEEPGKDIWLFGGASLAGVLMKANLVDEISVAVHPILLGSGKPLFENLPGRINLKLINNQPYSSGLVVLNYSVQHTQ